MPLLTADHILHEDDDLLVLSKPSGLLSQPSVDPARPYLAHEAAALLQELHALSSPPYLAIHHRLDVDTSGVIVLAKSRRANKPLMRAFKEREVMKCYLAICSSPPDDTTPPPQATFEVKNHLAAQKQQKHKDSKRRGPAPQIAVHAGGDFAHTAFDLLDTAPDQRAHLIQARPSTGRRHQIRAHLSQAGLPILGDALYGGVERVARARVARVMLHAHSIELEHPTTQELVRFVAPLPADMRDLLDELGLARPFEL